MRLNISSVVITIHIVSMCLGLSSAEGKIMFKNEDYSASEDVHLDCTTPYGSTGKCVDIRTCPLLFSAIGKPDQREFLDKAKCGWNETNIMVCCDTEWNCSTPDNEFGRCIKFTSCPHILAMITTYPVSQATISSVRSLRCGEMFNVCCTSVPLKPENTVKESPTPTYLPDDNGGSCQLSSMLPEPPSNCCGQDASSNRIIGGEPAYIDQYPWAAGIEYRGNNNDINLLCGGTLISGRYVLTAAHCLSVKKWTPVSVRLGEYNIDNPGSDCIEVEGGGEDCSDDPIVILIENMILHPEYNVDSPGQVHDIALIKLQDAAPYTDFIRPICLPTYDFTKTASSKTVLKVTGWGVVSEKQRYSPIKLHVSVPFVKREDCYDVYSPLHIYLQDGQICAGGVKGKDSCKGDSGGGLMLIRNNLTEIVGITSFGFTPCGLENKPAVYTNIYPYLSWIRMNLN